MHADRRRYKIQSQVEDLADLTVLHRQDHSYLAFEYQARLHPVDEAVLVPMPPVHDEPLIQPHVPSLKLNVINAPLQVVHHHKLAPSFILLVTVNLVHFFMVNSD